MRPFPNLAVLKTFQTGDEQSNAAAKISIQSHGEEQG